MHLELHPLGPFSLAASSRFIEGFPAGQGGGEGRLDLAFCADGDWRAIGVRVRDAEDHDGVVAEVRDNRGGVAGDVVLREVERMLSLDSTIGSGSPTCSNTAGDTAWSVTRQLWCHTAGDGCRADV